LPKIFGGFISRKRIGGTLVPLSDWNLILGTNREALIDVEELDEDTGPRAIVCVFVRILRNIEEVLFYNVRKHGDELRWKFDLF
jgi:hypothetical protein